MFRAERGQSEVIGVVLLLGLTVIVVGSTVALGSVALSDSQTSADLQKAENAMTQVDSKASLVAHGDSTSQSVDVAAGDGANVYVDDDAGEMTIDIEATDNTTTVDLDAIVYENDDSKIAYQGGGVWRMDGDHSRMVSPPEFHYRGATLTLPIVNIQGDVTTGDDLILSSTEDAVQKFPDDNHSNPIRDGNVTITVESEYHEAWGDFFEDRTEADVERLGDDRVRVELPTEVPASDITESTSAITAGSGFDLSDQDVDYLEVNTYDSETGETDTRNATVWFDGDVGADPGSEERVRIYGDLHADGDASGQGNPNPASWEGDGGNHGMNVSGEVRTADYGGDPDSPDVDPSTVIDEIIDEPIAEFDERNLSETAERYEDDLEASGGSITENTYVDGDIEIKEDSLDLASDGDLAVEISGDLIMESDESPAELTLDTGDEGDELHLMVRDDFKIESDGEPVEINVTGDGELSLYLQGDFEVDADGGDAEIKVEDDATVETYHDSDDDVEFDADDASVSVTSGDGEDPGAAGRFWLFSKSEEIEWESDGSDDVAFNGMVYAPNAEFEIEGSATVDGALVVDDMDLDGAELEISFDESLGQYDPFVDRESISLINHLHISTHPITVEGE